MNLNLAKFKKISEDEHSATLKHPAGHSIKIAKTSISKDMRDQLGALPMHLDEGGPVDQPNSAQIDSAQPQQQPTIVINNTPPPQQNFNPTADLPYDPKKAAYNLLTDPKLGDAAKQEIAEKNGVQMTPDQINQTLPQTGGARVPDVQPNVPPAPTQPAPVNDPYGNQAYLNNYSAGLNEAKAGIAGEANAQGAQGNAEAKTLQEAIPRQQQQAQTYDQRFNALMGERQNFQTDYQNKQIDPEHYLNSMGTMQKVKTFIGLVLGGMGTGNTHGENPAMAALNNHIDRDIKAQAMNMDKSMNLLKANLQQFGNLRDATDMTRVMQNDIVSSQLKLAGAQAQSPLAKARALKAAGELDMKSAPIMSQLAMRQSLIQGAKLGSVDPASTIRMIVPEAQQAAAYKELQTAQNMARQKDNLMGAFDSLTTLNTIGNRTTSPIQTPKQVNAIREPLLAQLVKDAEGRITPQDVPMIRSLFPSPGDSEETVQMKRNQMNKFVSEKMNFPMLQSYGINADSMGRFNPQGGKRIQLGSPVVQ